jgi:hypothetical protein
VVVPGQDVEVAVLVGRHPGECRERHDRRLRRRCELRARPGDRGGRWRTRRCWRTGGSGWTTRVVTRPGSGCPVLAKRTRTRDRAYHRAVLAP